MHPGVVVQHEDVVAGRGGKADVDRFAEADILLVRKHPHVGELLPDDRHRVVARPVIDDDDLYAADERWRRIESMQP